MALNNYPYAKKVDYDDKTETVYYTEQGRPDKDNMRLYDNIDWLELAKDKVALTDLFDNNPGIGISSWRVTALIDAVQENAQERGYPVVWHMCTESWAQIERDKAKTRTVLENAAIELFDTLSAVVDSACGSIGPDHRAVSDTSIAAARALLKRLEADDGSPRE